jgi:hypothetical protein
MSNEITGDQDSGYTFLCVDCDYNIHTWEKPTEPVCYWCRYIREHPDLPTGVRKLLRD